MSKPQDQPVVTGAEVATVDEANVPTMIRPTSELVEKAYDAVINGNLPPEVGDPAVTARSIQERIRRGSFDESMTPAESLPSWGDTYPGQLVTVLSFHLNPSTFEAQEGPNKGKKGAYAVVELIEPEGEIVTVQTGAGNILTQLVKAWEEERFPFPAVLESKATGQAGRSVQWLRAPDPAA